MGFRRYVATSAREALEKIRKELGAEAVILSNRRTAAGKVEIIAAEHGQMRALVEDLAAADARATRSRPNETGAERPGAPVPRRAAPESFQEFIRRQSTMNTPRLDGAAMYAAVAKEQDPAVGSAGPLAADGGASQAVPPAVFRRRPSRLAAADQSAGEDADARNAAAPAPPAARAATTGATPAGPRRAATGADAREAAPAGEQVPASTSASLTDARVMAELQSLRSALSDRISNLETKIATAPAPGANRDGDAGALEAARQALTRLLMSGFSPELARRISEVVPATLEPQDVDKWLQAVIARHVRCPADADNPLFQPGAIALVGPTGVGKTTTIAKLAARFVVRHGASALGLVTLDSYRIGGHEQLRSYGRILGVPVHNTHDAVSLRDLLASMSGKRQILIDTCGVSQRDQRLAEMLAMIEEVRFMDQKIGRVLLVNAASHAETLDEVARAWRVDSSQGAVLTKIDEAARIGGALDAVLRFQMPLLGLTNGQRVPEDWHPGNPPLLAHIALKPFGAAFRLGAAEMKALSGRGALLA